MNRVFLRILSIVLSPLVMIGIYIIFLFGWRPEENDSLKEITYRFLKHMSNIGSDIR